MNPAATMNGHERFLWALRSRSDDSAWTAFQDALVSRPVRPWLRALAATALRREHAGPDSLDAAVESARTDRAAGLTLFARLASDGGGIAQAIVAARQAVVIVPDRAEPLFLLCGLLLRASDAEAQPILDRCLALFPAETTGWLGLAETLADRGKRDAALVCAERAARGQATPHETVRRGLLLRSIGRLGDARAAFSDATAMEPAAKRAWFLLGLCAQDERDLANAAAAYRMALSIDPALAEAALNLGTVLQEQGGLDAAKACYGQAIMSRPDTFGRAAQALTTAPKGELWLDLDALRRALRG